MSLLAGLEVYILVHYTRAGDRLAAKLPCMAARGVPELMSQDLLLTAL